MGLKEEKALVFTNFIWKGTITKRCESITHPTLARYVSSYTYWEMQVLEEVIQALEEGIGGCLSAAEKIDIGLGVCDIWITSEQVEVYTEGGLPYESKELWSHSALLALLRDWKAFLQSPPYEGEEAEAPPKYYFSVKTWRYGALAVFGYLLFRTELRYSPERFTDAYVLRFGATLVYFLPLLGFGTSIQLLLLPAGYTWRSKKRIFIDAAIATLIAVVLTFQLYDLSFATLPLDLTREWDNGFFGRASDFKVEFCIAFLLNCIAFIYHHNKKEPFADQQRKEE